MKVSCKGRFTAEDWSRNLANAPEEDIKNAGTPNEIQALCIQIACYLAMVFPHSKFKLEHSESLGWKMMKQRNTVEPEQSLEQHQLLLASAWLHCQSYL
jgi:hypothetical protein